MTDIRFVTSADGTRIAYTTFGQGPPMVEIPRWAATIEWINMDEEVREFYEELGRIRQVTIVERRGSGASQRSVTDFSMEAHVADVTAVVDALGLTRFDLLGSGDGSAICLKLASENADRVTALVLWDAYATVPSVGMASSGEALRNVTEMFRLNWPFACRLTADVFFPDMVSDRRLRIAELWASEMNGETAYKYMISIPSLNVAALLPMVKAPALILHRRDKDPGAGHTVVSARDLASKLPNARFVLVDGTAGVHQIEHEQVIAEIRRFLTTADGTQGQTASHLPFRTVIFTDLVGHTEMMSRLGDDRGRDVLREYERITREVLKPNGGTEVKTMGDGFMASFGSVTKAVECAIALQRAFTDREGEPLSVRVGLNAGEPIAEDGDLFGATVILASRIAAKADGGEILVADTVRGLCSGKGFLFVDRGEFLAKGFEEPVRVYEVRWQNG